MVIGYHSIFTTYGTWLPNDPRGSYSKEVYNRELKALGPVWHGRQSPQPDRRKLSRFHTAARPRLNRSPYFIDESTRPAAAAGFRQAITRLGIIVVGCAIMDDHVHLVVLRSKYRIEYVVNQLKGAATRAMGLRQTPWARYGWNVFLDIWEAVGAAVRYVQANPPAAGMAAQHWDFVRPLPDSAW